MHAAEPVHGPWVGPVIWELDFGNSPPGAQGGAAHAFPESSVDASTIDYAYLFYWKEHCIECAVPECYGQCSLYKKRKDQKCACFENGIYANPAYPGPLGYGADISFRKWGKLESNLSYGPVGFAFLMRLSRLNRLALRYFINPVADALQVVDPKRRLNSAYWFFLHKAFKRMTPAGQAYDEFLLECWVPGDEGFSMMLEVFKESMLFRESFRLEPGHNLHRLPFRETGLDLSDKQGRVLLYPEGNKEVRVVFTWLSLVKYKFAKYKLVKYKDSAQLEKNALPESAPARHADRVKCLVWDLDNTLWDGILLEDGPGGIRPRQEALELVRALDRRGVVQSIASKNDHALAWQTLEGLGLSEYFVYPAINWRPKSENIQEIIAQLNVNPNTFAFIDDSEFERHEVSSRLPEVRVFADTDLRELLQRPEFNLPETGQGSSRRLSYLAEEKRKKSAGTHGGGYVSFLKSCKMQARVFEPKSEAETARCLELIQRSNQLNLSTLRYSPKEFEALLRDKAVLKYAVECCDRFGDYGIVGFSTISMKEGVEPLLCDFVVSCRVMSKKVENAWFEYLRLVLKGKGHKVLLARFRPTPHNSVMLETLRGVGFTGGDGGEDDSGGIMLKLLLDAVVPDSSVVGMYD